MRKILIASHSELAEGMKHTLQFFVGQDIDVTSICAYVDEEKLETKLERYFSQVDVQDEVLVFTDLLGGSVNQALLPYVQREHVHVIAGVFLGVILELVYRKESYLSKETVQETLNHSKEGIVYMNNYTIILDDVDE